MNNVKKVLIVFLCVALINLFLYRFVDAISVGSGFAGKITKADKSSKIENLENQGYKCAVPGKTFDIKPAKPEYPMSYLVPFSVKVKGGGNLKEQQSIKGTYKNKTPIVCILPSVPPQIQVVVLDTVFMAGNSKK